MSNIDEKKAAGASYIINFFKEVDSLTVTFAQYLNIMLEIETKYKSEVSVEEMTEHEKGVVTQTFQTLRYHALKCYVQYNAIKPILKFKYNEKLENSYKKVKNTFIIPRDSIEEYVTELNTLLLKNIIQNLLESSQDIVGKVFE